MSRRVVTAAPSFGSRLRELREQRGLSLRRLGDRVHYSYGYLWDVEQGRKPPTPDLADRLDTELDTGGTLSKMLVVTASTDDLDGDALDRLATVAARPRTVDTAAVEALSAMLACQRRLEDAIGAAPMVTVVTAQLALVESLAGEARGDVRERIVREAGQWAQFAGWLHESIRQPQTARRHYATALESATETGDTDMIATALNMRGHLAWVAGQAGPVVSLSRAAGRLAASPGVRALAAQQEARGHALLGEADDTDRLLDVAQALAVEAAEHPEDEPPWIYFHGQVYLEMQRGLADFYLGRHRRAVESLTAGLAAMPAETRRSEWVAPYVHHLALAHLATGDREAARAGLVELLDLADTASSVVVVGLVADLSERIDAVG